MYATLRFQKNKRSSPRIKASLSHAAIENLKSGRGSAVGRQKLRTNYSNAGLLRDENVTPNYTSRVVMSAGGGKRSKSASALKAAPPSGKKVHVVRANRALKEQNFLLRGGTKSWSHLMMDSGDEESLVKGNRPRYLTRSKAKKISKSMSDLLQI